MQPLSDAGRQLVESLASRHGVSIEAVTQLLMALAAGGGRQAQFNHPDLGGMGQWSQGGMIMVGDMFNQGLKLRVDTLCNELAAALQTSSPFTPVASSMQSQSQSSGASGTSLFVPGTFGSRWPEELGAPASTGSQNDLRYAVFPGTRRLAIDQGGRLTVYDIGDHQISGFSQQQSGDQSITFTSQFGLVRVADLKVVPTPATPAAPAPEAPEPAVRSASSARPPVEPASVQAAAPAEDTAATPAAAVPTSASSDDEIFSRIERLAELRKKDIITAEEFNAKKAELLARL